MKPEDYESRLATRTAYKVFLVMPSDLHMNSFVVVAFGLLHEEFLDALILGQSSPEEAYRRFDELSAKHVEMLRKGHLKQAAKGSAAAPGGSVVIVIVVLFLWRGCGPHHACAPGTKNIQDARRQRDQTQASGLGTCFTEIR